MPGKIVNVSTATPMLIFVTECLVLQKLQKESLYDASYKVFKEHWETLFKSRRISIYYSLSTETISNTTLEIAFHLDQIKILSVFMKISIATE